MKLETSIKPRRDGVVRVEIAGLEPIVFENDGAGNLVAEVPDSAVPQLLATHNFYPADEADYHRAMSAAMASQSEDEDDDDDDDVGGGLPVEANTPPKPAKKPRKAAAAKE